MTNMFTYVPEATVPERAAKASSATMIACMMRMMLILQEHIAYIYRHACLWTAFEWKH
jgi:hypothetical protein